MYKCGWNGCEKAYGTLNHLNAHVTMQSHGQKRTPEGMFIALSSESSLSTSVAVMRRRCWGDGFHPRCCVQCVLLFIVPFSCVGFRVWPIALVNKGYP